MNPIWSLSFIATMRVPPTVPLTATIFADVAPFDPPPLSVQALNMSASPARARDRTKMLCGAKIIGLPVEVGGHPMNPP